MTSNRQPFWLTNHLTNQRGPVHADVTTQEPPTRLEANANLKHSGLSQENPLSHTGAIRHMNEERKGDRAWRKDETGAPINATRVNVTKISALQNAKPRRTTGLFDAG
jgi:hypothetical protein